MSEMAVREGTEQDIPVLQQWSEQDFRVGRALEILLRGLPLAADSLSEVAPEWGFIENGEPVAMIALTRLTDKVGFVTFIGSPEHRTFEEMSPAYDEAMEEAKRRGILVAVVQIEHDNEHSIAMAKRKGFRPSVLQMVKVLT